MIYFDNAATTFPKPSCVVEEMSKCIKKYCGNPGRSSHSISIKSAEKIYEARMLLSEMFNSEPENVVFTYNTTYALNIAIKSLIKYSTNVLISDIEHNSVLRPIIKLSNEKLCTYDIFSTLGEKDDILKSIKSKLTKNTSMIVCTHSSNVGSKTLPIKEIGDFCNENNITFIVDAAQSAGIYKIDVKNMHIDALCLPAHKGLYGPQGVGAIIYNTNKQLKTVIEGGTGINSLEETMPDFLPEMQEAGTLSTPAISGWCEALKWIKSLDIGKIRLHEEDLYKLCLKNLRENSKIITYEMSNSPGNTLLFNIKSKTASLVCELFDKYNICLRGGFHCAPLAHNLLKTGENGAVRISFSVFNTRNELYQFFDVLNDITKKI